MKATATIRTSSVAKQGEIEEEAYRLRPKAIWRLLQRQSPAFLFTWTYVFFEYVRPQSIYKWIDVLPWARLCILSAVLLCILEGRLRFGSKLLWLSIALFTAVIIASSITAYSPQTSWDARTVWINWLLLMLIIGAGTRSRHEFFLLMVGFTLWNFKMSQHGVRSWAMAGFQFRTWGVTGAPGWFTNSGEFAIEMCIFFPLAGYLAYGLWPQLARNARIAMGAIAFSALVSIIASSSRGGLIGAGAVGIWMILRSPQKLKTLALVASLSWVTWTLLPEGSKARFESIGTDDTSQHRLDYWRDGLAIAAQHPLLGIGYDNWIPYYQKFYNETGELPHNFFIECIAELGYSGGAALILVFGAYFLQNAKVRRITAPTGRRPDRFLWAASYGLDGAMVGFIASGSFVTVLYYPFIWMNVAMSMALYGAVLREVRAATPIRNGPRRPA